MEQKYWISFKPIGLAISIKVIKCILSFSASANISRYQSITCFHLHDSSYCNHIPTTIRYSCHSLQDYCSMTIPLGKVSAIKDFVIVLSILSIYHLITYGTNHVLLLFLKLCIWTPYSAVGTFERLVINFKCSIVVELINVRHRYTNHCHKLIIFVPTIF